MSICNRYSNTTEAAEEMLQNGFLKIFININQFENKGSFEGWMKKVVVNSCLDYIKAKQNKEFPFSNRVGDTSENGNHFDKVLYEQGVYEELLYEEKLTVAELAMHLNSLPELTKTVFNLYVFEEYSHKEISITLQIAERTSQWHLSNAKKTLSSLILKKNTIKNVMGL
jgi:RNA polymerase sigma-70 factor (ECF subfamily)